METISAKLVYKFDKINNLKLNLNATELYIYINTYLIQDNYVDEKIGSITGGNRPSFLGCP